jgi:Mg/Co/Ni transporter MgtE
MTNNKQQTAVEWLSEKVLHREWELLTQEKKRKILEQAKEMEKQQIINAFWNGDNTDCTSEQNIEEFAEQYYNETYGGGEQ